MNINDLRIPDSLIECHTRNHIFAFEGVDACGKTSICDAFPFYSNEVVFVRIPGAYINEPFKHYLYFETSPMSSALIFTASLIDRLRKAQTHSGKYVVMDRSLWSTVALNWAQTPQVAQDVLNLFGSVVAYLPIPEKAYVLDVPYEVCRERVLNRSNVAQKYDDMPYSEFQRHMEFYYWLAEKEVGVTIISPGTKSIHELCEILYRDMKGTCVNE